MGITKNALVSWQTTAMGTIGGVLLMIYPALDHSPETNIGPASITMGLAIVGIGVAARDGNKSSQQMGVRP